MRGECARVNEDVFGPVVHGCQDDFDFTLLFEETILFLLPALCMLLLAFAWRAPQLIRANAVVRSSLLGLFKSVSLMSYQNATLTNLPPPPPTPPNQQVWYEADDLGDRLYILLFSSHK